MRFDLWRVVMLIGLWLQPIGEGRADLRVQMSGMWRRG